MALARVAEAGGEYVAPAALVTEVRCRFGLAVPPHMPSMNRGESPASLSAALLPRALANAATLESFRHEAGPNGERIAWLAALQHPEVLVRWAEEVDDGASSRVLETVAGALSCLKTTSARTQPPELQARLAAVHARFSALNQKRSTHEACDEDARVRPEIIEAMAAGHLKVNGWGQSGDSPLQIHLVARGRPRLALPPQCALSAYDQLTERGQYQSSLVLPLATSASVPEAHRREAARRLSGHLTQYPEDERARHAAALVNAGHSVDYRVPFAASHTSIEQLAAAARQGDAQARTTLLGRVACGGGRPEGVEHLGAVQDKAAADLAFRLGRECEGAAAKALLALIELGDARAVTLLEPALNEPFSRTFELAAALRKQPVPGVLEALEALDAKGLRSAKELRARMARD